MKCFTMTDTMKKLMIFCNNSDNAERYEFCFNKDKNILSIRFFTAPDHCVLLQCGVSDFITVKELHWVTSYYSPSKRVTYIRKYLDKYRIKTPWGYKTYTAEVNLEQAIRFLKKLKFDKNSTYYRVNFVEEAS